MLVDQTEELDTLWSRGGEKERLRGRDGVRVGDLSLPTSLEFAIRFVATSLIVL